MNETVFKALCACLGLSPSSEQALSLIRQAYTEPENTPQPARSAEVVYWSLSPEEERHEKFIAIYTDFALSLGADHGSTYTGPDRIHWNNGTWRVARVRDWAMFGYYQALAVKQL